jgi:hypothetical protein
MKKLSVLLFFSIAFVFFCSAQAPDSVSAQKLISVDALLAKVKPDTSSIPADSINVDTVYIDNPMNVVKIGADFASAYSLASITYERVIHFVGSVQLKLELLGTMNPMTNFAYIKDTYLNSNKVMGVGIVPEVRYYGSEKYAPKGLFVGAYVPLRFANVEVPTSIVKDGLKYTLEEGDLTQKTSDLSYNLVGIGANIGYHFIYKKSFSVELVTGVSIAKGTFSVEEYVNNYSIRGVQFTNKLPLKDGMVGNAFYPRAELCLGWSF